MSTKEETLVDISGFCEQSFSSIWKSKSRNRLIIEALNAKDLSVFSELAQHELIRFHFLPPLAREIEANRYKPQSCKDWIKDPSSICLLAWLGENLAGFIHASLGAGVAWLNWVVVKESFRKRNICWYLWKRLFHELRGRSIHLVWGAIIKTNTDSIIMAERIGFKYLAAAPEFLHGQDHILVSRSLMPAFLPNSTR